MTTSPHLEKLRDAIQGYVHAKDGDNLLVTDFAVTYASIDMHTATEIVWLGTAAHGAPHATLGLAHVLVNDLTGGGNG